MLPMAPDRTADQTAPRHLTDWNARHKDLFGQHTVNLGHTLHESPLFSDAALAKLIEKAPPGSYHVNTMDPKTHDPKTRKEGQIKGLSGLEVLEAVKNGTIWIILRDPGATDPAYRALLKELYDELRERTGQNLYREKMQILISSPKVQVYYHCDVPGQTLWQVRGTKRAYVYPNAAPFLPPEKLERIVLGEAHEISLGYDGWYDDYAEVVELTAGRMLHWPLNCPHRIVNGDMMNVSFTTEHWTDDLRNIYAVNYANGILRSRLGAAPKRITTGPSLWAKMGLAAAYKASGLAKQRRKPFRIEFEVDPKAPHSVRPIAAFEVHK
jgi:hypothetical protein